MTKGKVTISTTKIEQLKPIANFKIIPNIQRKTQNKWETRTKHEAIAMKILGYATYEKALANFNPIKIENNYHQMLLHSASSCDEGTKISWNYNSTNIEADSLINAPKLKEKELNFKALMQRSVIGQTPWIDLDNVSLELYGFENKGIFITKMRMLVTDSVKSTNLYVNAKIPKKTSLVWYASCNDGKNWIEMKKNQEDRIVGNNLIENSYTAEFETESQSNKMRFKAKFFSESTAKTPEIHGMGATLS